MGIDALGKGAFTAAAVLMVLFMLRHGGLRLAALSAAIPVTSAPALYWLALDHGAAYATQAAIASLHATGLTAVLALAYAWAARRGGGLQALLLAVLCTLMALLVTHRLAASLSTALSFAVLAVPLVRWTLPRTTGRRATAGPWGRQAVATALTSGAITVLVSLLAPHLPPLACGLAATIPVVGMTSLVTLHGRSDADVVGSFLRSYVSGLGAKIGFLLALTLMLGQMGPGLAWVIAAAVGAATLLATAAAPRALAAARRACNRHALQPVRSRGLA